MIYALHNRHLKINAIPVMNGKKTKKRKVISDAKSMPIFNKLTTRDYLEISISAVSGLYFQSIGNTFEDW